MVRIEATAEGSLAAIFDRSKFGMARHVGGQCASSGLSSFQYLPIRKNKKYWRIQLTLFPLSGQDGFMSLCRAPTSDSGSTLEKNFHEPDHAGVLDFDPGHAATAGRNGQGQALKEWEIDVHVECLSLEGSKAVGYCG